MRVFTILAKFYTYKCISVNIQKIVAQVLGLICSATPNLLDKSLVDFVPEIRVN
jgi:hypothetical protein